MNELKNYSEDKSLWGFMYKGLKESLEVKKGKREASFELLRIISMMMVIILHYIGKGELLGSQSATSNAGFWLLEALSFVAVNVFVLISGYFLVNSNFSIYKIIGLWCQVFFYSVTIAVIASLAGIYSLSDLLCLKNILFFVFPGIYGHYWFATAYILMYIFSPLIAKGMKAVPKSTLQMVIVALLIPFCLAPSLSPFELATNDRGYSFAWFLFLFIAAGYIRLYGIKIFENKVVALAIYFFSSLALIAASKGLAIFIGQHPEYDVQSNAFYRYNFVFVLIASIGLFYFFKNLKIKEGFFSSLIIKISPYVFGIYLLHEHLTIRYEWLKWFKVSDVYGAKRIIHLIMTVIIIFTVGIIVDYIRSIIFYLCKKFMLVCLNIYFAKQEMWDYLIFGFLATVVNWIAYLACSYCLLIPLIENNETLLKTVGNIIAWIVAVIFAYWTNRNFVFKSKVTGAKAIFKEFCTFVGARIFSFVVEQAMFFTFLVMHVSDIIGKLIISVVVIILNYLFSKLFVFKKKKQD